MAARWSFPSDGRDGGDGRRVREWSEGGAARSATEVVSGGVETVKGRKETRGKNQPQRWPVGVPSEGSRHDSGHARLRD